MSKLLEVIRNRAVLDVAPTSSEELVQRNIVEEKFREQDQVFRVQSNGCWNDRRIVLSKDKLAFAFKNEESEIDYIPLAEVEFTNEMKETVTVHENEEEVQLRVMQIATIQEGYNSGRAYYLGTDSEEIFQTFYEHLTHNIKAERKRLETHSVYLKLQRKVRKIYDSDPFQGLVAALITANFIFTIIESEQVHNLTDSDGTPTQLSRLLDWLNEVFTYIFTVELVINAFAHWFKSFILDPWNALDMIVVATSIMSLVVTSGSTGTVRIMRAFRVIRLFGRLKALKKIITALTLALLPVVNVFIILFLLLSIAAIVGVTLFRDTSPDGFAMFSIAFFTLFRVTSGDPWPETLGKVNDDGSVNWLAELYSTIYIIIVVWVILQVSVAVLLDNFISASSQMDREELLKLAQAKQKEQLLKNPMEPLLLKLAREFTDNKDLTEKLQKLYVALDTDRSGGLDSQEFCAAIKKLVQTGPIPVFLHRHGLMSRKCPQDFKPRIHMSDADFRSITKNGQLCDEKGHLGLREFEIVMREQIRHVAQSKLVLITNIRSSDESDFMLHGTLKMIFMEQCRLQQAVEEILHRVDGAPVAAPAKLSSVASVHGSLRSMMSGSYRAKHDKHERRAPTCVSDTDFSLVSMMKRIEEKLESLSVSVAQVQNRRPLDGQAALDGKYCEAKQDGNVSASNTLLENNQLTEELEGRDNMPNSNTSGTIYATISSALNSDKGNHDVADQNLGQTKMALEARNQSVSPRIDEHDETIRVSLEHRNGVDATDSSKSKNIREICEIEEGKDALSIGNGNVGGAIEFSNQISVQSATKPVHADVIVPANREARRTSPHAELPFSKRSNGGELNDSSAGVGLIARIKCELRGIHEGRNGSWGNDGRQRRADQSANDLNESDLTVSRSRLVGSSPNKGRRRSLNEALVLEGSGAPIVHKLDDIIAGIEASGSNHQDDFNATKGVE